MISPKNKRFKIRWWCWYLVDLNNYHNPVIVRKHFQNEEMASEYNKNYMVGEFSTIIGHKATELGLKDWHNYKPTHRHKTKQFPKYHYPKGVNTWKEKELYRLRQRRKLGRMKRLPEITVKDLYHILEKKPIRFARRCKAYANWEYAYSLSKPSLKHYKKALEWPRKVTQCTIIELTLNKYGYDTGPWPIHIVVLEIYKQYGDSIEKFIMKGCNNPEKARKELIARGFVKDKSITHSGYSDECYVGSPTQFQWNLYWPTTARLGAKAKGDIRLLVYDLQKLVGVSGFTTAFTNGKYKAC